MDKPNWKEATCWKFEKTEFLRLNFEKSMTSLVFSQNKTLTGPNHFLSRVATIHSLKIRYVSRYKRCNTIHNIRGVK